MWQLCSPMLCMHQGSVVKAYATQIVEHVEHLDSTSTLCVPPTCLGFRVDNPNLLKPQTGVGFSGFRLLLHALACYCIVVSCSVETQSVLFLSKQLCT